MKKITLGILAVFCLGILLFASCKKDGSTTDQVQSSEQQLKSPVPSSRSVSAREGDEVASVLSQDPTGTLEISQELFNAEMEGQSLEVTQTGDHQYLALRPIVNGGGGDPCLQAWENYYNWFATAKPQFLAVANSTCKPVYFCYTTEAPCRLAIKVVVKPTNPRCITRIDYTRFQQVYEFREVRP